MDYHGDGSPDNEQYTSVNSMSTERRISRRHSPRQIQILEAYFEVCPHPNDSERQKLCKELDLQIDQVKSWFQNKRTQSKVQEERNSNIWLLAENEKIRCENAAMFEALENKTCPPCGCPPLGIDEQRSINAILRREHDILADIVAKIKHQQTMMDSLTSVQRQQTFETPTSYGYNPNSPFERPSSSESQTIQPQLLPPMDILQLSEAAESAVEELKRLFSTEDAPLWVMSSIYGTYVIEQNSYDKFSRSVGHNRNSSVRVESSKDVTEVPIEATSLIEIFLDSIWEQLHILSPLVPPREFMIVRCCQKIEEGLWIIADVSQNIVNSDHQVSPSCYKRPSGVLIRALSNAHTEVTWIEHVEVDHTPETHQVYRDLVSGGWGYGAKRWIVTLNRMCERMALSSTLTMPATDWGETIATVERRRSVMKLGERMLKNFNEMLIMPRNVALFPLKTKCGGVRISTRWNMGAGQVTGLVASSSFCLSIPLTPLHVFNSLRSNDSRHKWDVLCQENAITETARIFTGPSETNYISLLETTPPKMNVLLQECYMDAIGGMIVCAPLDMATMSNVAYEEVDPSEIPILHSGFTISSDRRGSMDGGTLLTVAFQNLLSGENSMSTDEMEKSIHQVNCLISTTVESIKKLLDCHSDSE